MNILIVNAWGGNRGDEAMINSLFRVLRAAIPEAKISLLPYRYERLDVVPEIQQIGGRNGVYYYSSLSPSFAAFRKFPKQRVIFRPLLWLVRQFARWDTRFLSRFDLVISAPQGPTISDMYDTKLKTLHPLEQARRLGIPYAIAGVSMGPFSKTRDEARVEMVLQGAEGIVVREDISRTHLVGKYPALSLKVESYIDLVFATPVDLSQKDAAIAGRYRQFVDSLDTASIGACISLTPARDPRRPFSRRKQIEKMVLFFDHVLGTTGRAIVLFPHLDVDLPILQQIRGSCKDPSRIIIMPTELDSEFQQDLVGRLEFFISTRYHPTIFAIKAGTAFMCIKNQFKVEGMLAKLDITQECCWQDDTLETYRRVFDANWRDRVGNGQAVRRGAAAAELEAHKYHAFFGSLGTRIRSR